MSILDSMKGDGKLQTEKELAAKKDIALEKKIDAVMGIYEGWLDVPRPQKSYAKDHRFDHAMEMLEYLTIDQGLIDGFLVRLGSHHGREQTFVNGLFISALIQNAYEQGRNDLLIQTSLLEKRTDNVGAYLSGSRDNPVRVTIGGDVGIWCGLLASHSEFTVEGDADNSYGRCAKHSRFTIKGDTGNDCGAWAEHSEFILHSSVGRGSGWWADACTFYSVSEDILRGVREVAKHSTCLYLIRPDGTAEPYGLRTKFKHHVLRQWRSL